MVRTEYVGYLRDIRRIIVALSRARLGLYVFGKYDLFAQIPESKQSFN
jgi:intron-binding protein aquarius